MYRFTPISWQLLYVSYTLMKKEKWQHGERQGVGWMAWDRHGLWSPTMASRQGVETGLGSIRGMQAVLVQAQQVACGRNWEGPCSNLLLPFPLSVVLPCHLPSKGLMLSPLHEFPTPNLPGRSWWAWRMFYAWAGPLSYSFLAPRLQAARNRSPWPAQQASVPWL